MSEQLSYQLYKWLSSVGVLPTSLRYKTNGNYELDQKTAEILKSGFLLAKLLQFLAKEHGATINEPLLASVKQSNTPAAKTYNWNILAESFTKLNVTLGKDTQKEITAGNFNALVRFLLDLHKRFNPKKEVKRQQNSQAEINLKRLEVLQSYDQAETFLELSVMIISHSLSLTPKQALSTLSQNCKYYAHMVVKGIKNSFVQILTMLDTFGQQLSKLMFLCEKNPEKHTEFFLDLIKPTLISRDSEVAKKGCETFQKMLYESLKYNSKNLVYQILCKESVGFDFLYMGLKRHPDLVNQFTSFLFPLIREAFNDFFEIHLKRTINNEQQYLKIVLRIIEGLTASLQSKAVLKQSGLLNVWLKNSQLSFERRKNKEESPVNEQTKILYLELLCNLWKYYAAEVDQQYAEELLIKGIQQLKRNTRKDIYTIKVPALLRLFDFLHFLADSKNKVAPILYKKLIFLLIENHQEEEIRELILANFRVMLQKYPTIPIEFLVEPLLRQLVNSQSQSYIMNVFDFEFLIELCKHPRMDAANALSYLEFLSKLYIKSFIYAKLTIRVIEVLTNRFCQEEAIVEFMKKNIESTLNMYGILTFNKKKLGKEENIMNKQKKSLAIELIKHFTHLEHQELAQFIQQKVIELYLLWAETKKHLNKGLKYIIELYGDVEELCLQYRVKESRRQEFSMPMTSEATIKQSNLSRLAPQTQIYQELEYMKEKGIGYKVNKKANTEDLIQRNLLKANPAALEHLQRMKEKLKGEASRKKEIEDIQLKKLKEKNNMNSLELLQRNLSLGYAKLVPATEEQTLFQFGTVKPKQLKLASHFHSLQELQQIDKQSTKVILKQYAKDIKSIFLKYALISSTHQNKRKEQSAPVMSFTEVVKMLNEKGMSEVNKFVVSDIIASINYSKRKERNVLFGIEEPEFTDFLIKISDFMIQNEQNSQEVPFGLKLQKVIKNLLTSQVFYQNRLRIKEDAQISKLRQALKNDQAGQLQIPQGYRKVKQSQVALVYVSADRDWGVPQRFRIGYELADWLLSKCLDLHVMTPCVEIKQRYNLIQIPKPFKPKIPKQETDPKIKYQPEGKVQENEFLQDAKIMTPGKLSENSPQRERYDRRSQSQRAIHKTKMDPVVLAEEEKQKALKREKYVLQLKQNLQKLKQEKALKQQAKKAEEAEKREKEKKKEEQRKQYINSNKQKVDQFRKKQVQEKVKKQEEDRRIKEAALQERKKREKELFQKHQEDIKKRADVLSEKRRELQNSKDRKAKQFQKLAKESVAVKQDVQQQKLRMLEIKNSLQNGVLKTIVSQHQKEFKQLYSSYFNWDKNKIQLHAIALLLRDFQISPELVLPKTIADVYKSTGKGQALDFQGFIQCLTKCAYKSPKLQGEENNETQGINPKLMKKLIQKLKMEEDNYKEVVKIVKNHLQ